MSKSRTENPRLDIDKKTEELSSKNIYVGLVNGVNAELIKKGVPIGENMNKAVNLNLEEIKNGTGTNPEFHAREVVALSKDSYQYVKQGDYKTAGFNVFGAVINTFAFLTAGKYQQVEEKREQIFGPRHGGSNNN